MAWMIRLPRTAAEGLYSWEPLAVAQEEAEVEVAEEEEVVLAVVAVEAIGGGQWEDGGMEMACDGFMFADVEYCLEVVRSTFPAVVPREPLTNGTDGG